MDDSILERAKLLAQAANQMAAELSSQAQEYKVIKIARSSITVLAHSHLKLSKRTLLFCC